LCHKLSSKIGIAGFKSQALVTGLYDKNEAVVLARPFPQDDEIVTGSKIITLSCFTEDQPFEKSQSATIDDFVAGSLTLGQITKIQNGLIYITDGQRELTCSGIIDSSYLQKQVMFLPLFEDKVDILGIRLGSRFVPITVSAESPIENGSKLL
jgi:hypothetical protein